MDLDLNREPVQPQSQPFAGESPPHSLVELEDSHGRIQERMRLLESVIARGKYLRRPPLQSSSTSQETKVIPQPQAHISPCKIDGGTHLIAEALAMNSSCEPNPPSTSSTSPSLSSIRPKLGGSIFDCNICFSISKDPIVTCCGHLFCWPCFYTLPNCDSYYSKECPVCQGEVLENDITPIYNGVSATSSTSSDPNAVKVPPRPRARRINNTRPRLAYPQYQRAAFQRALQSFGGVPPPWLVTSNSPAVTGLIPPRPVTEGPNVATVNSMASVYPQSQPEADLADAHSESPVTNGIDGSQPAVMRRSSSRRVRNDGGLNFRNQRRRGDWFD